MRLSGANAYVPSRIPLLCKIPPKAARDEAEGSLRGARVCQQRPGSLHHYLKKTRTGKCGREGDKGGGIGEIKSP